jgi:hypothetical protein
MAMEEEVLSIEDCIGRRMNADVSEIRPLADDVVELMECLNMIEGTK